MTQTFIDTILVCTMTGLVLIVSSTWNNGSTGATLTSEAFNTVLSGGKYIVTIGLVLFAYSTILGWSYYGEKSFSYLFGDKSVMPYRIAFVIAVVVGATMELKLVWGLADIFNALMAFPNLIALLLLSPVVIKGTREYFEKK